MTAPRSEALLNRVFRVRAYAERHPEDREWAERYVRDVREAWSRG